MTFRRTLPIGVVLRGSFAILFVFHLERLIHLRTYIAVAPGAGSLPLSLACCTALQLGLLLSALRPRRWLSLLCLLLSFTAWDLTPEIYYGADQLAFNLLLFNCFLSGTPQRSPDFIEALGRALLLGELCIIYFMNGWSKLQEPAWVDGTVVREHIYPAIGSLGTWLTTHLTWVAVLIGILTILLQFSIVGVLFQKTRWMTALAFVGFHLCIAGTLHFVFGIVCATIHCLVMTYSGSIWKDLGAVLFIRSGEDTR